MKRRRNLTAGVCAVNDPNSAISAPKRALRAHTAEPLTLLGSPLMAETRGASPNDVQPWQPGQLLVVGFDGCDAVPGDLAERISQGRVGGVILFKRNVRDPGQLRTLVGELYSYAPPNAPLLVSIDQEGGRVQRLRDPWTEWPPMRVLGDVNDPLQSEALGRCLAQELVDLGISLDFAPDVDVDSNPDNPVIGDRSFGRDPALVSTHARALLAGLQGGGVAGCAKHFPGHGDTNKDSHFDLPRLDHDLERLRRVELPPFAAMVEAEVASMMSAHVLFPKLDAKRPGTFSPEVMALLRHELGYQGLVFTDDLEMGAVAKHWGPRDRALLPLQASVDSLLVCHSADLREEMLAVLERAPDATVERALERMVAFKQSWGRSELPKGALGPPYEAHQQLAETLKSSGESLGDSSG